MDATVVAISAGNQPGLTKFPVAEAHFVADVGLSGDRHARGGPRQISVIAAAAIEHLGGLGIVVSPGQLGENVIVDGVDVDGLQPGDRLVLGGATLEVTQIRQPCRSVMAIDRRALKALVGRAGQYARVVESGRARSGDRVEVLAVTATA
jgi:MOSC domain-containing protein YiiM